MAAAGSWFSQHSRRVIVAVVILTLATWSAALYSIASQIGHPFPGFLYTTDRHVSALTPQDFSGMQTGLRVHDYIVAVNGQHWREMPQLVREAGIGGSLEYTLEREGRLLQVTVPTMEFTPDILLRFLSGWLVFCAVSLSVSMLVYATAT